jgi:diguanylate cyclase (GGDEF)-like protein/PAS domain S-box-containing protein
MSWHRITVAAVFERMPLPVAVTDASGVAVYANPALRTLLGVHRDRWAPCRMAALRAPDDGQDVVIRRAVARCGSWEGETRLVTAAGVSVQVAESVHLFEADASVLQVHFMQDLTALRRVQELSSLAYHDSLTGLPNRNLLADRVASAMSRALRNGRPFALLYLDIDGLKAVNDTAGHAAGDEFVRAVARALQRALRKRDTIARLGGDEFVVIVEEVDGHRGAAKVADKLLTACRRTRAADTGQPVTVSAGISLFPRHGASMEALLQRADAALYQAKARGRNCYMFAEEARGCAWETPVATQ